MRVATFNLHHCAGRDGVLALDRTVAAIRETGADLVALQELDRYMDRSGGIDQPTELGRLLDMEVTFAPTLHRRDGAYGIALAARPPVADARFVALPRLDTEEPRGALTARWGSLNVVCTHLSTRPAVNTIQTAALAALAEDLDEPLVVLGDLNQPRRSLGVFTRRGYRGAFGHATLPRRFPKRQIDHILVSRGIQIARSWTIQTEASDHLPLVADLRIL